MAPSAITNEDLYALQNGRNRGNNADPLCNIITPVGMLGYGFEEEQVIAALEAAKSISAPTALILDSGSTDSGPSKLALGSMTCPRSSYERDIGKLLPLVERYKAPLLISSAGGDGSDEHVDVFLEIIRELANQPNNRYALDSDDANIYLTTSRSWKLKVLAIYSGIQKTLVLERLHNGQIVGCGPSVPDLTIEDVKSSPRIVAQMGPEPFVQAMAAHPDFDIIIGGRAYDPSPYVAYCVYNALKIKTMGLSSLGEKQLGAFNHMGKILECGGLCTTPKTMGARGTIYKDSSFTITPLDSTAKCIPISVAAHTLYEKSRPDILHGPGGYLNLNTATYTAQPDDRTVLVRGSTFHSSISEGLPYTVKLEAARTVGFRTLMIGSFHDPILIPQIDDFLASVKAYVTQQHSHIKSSWDFDFHVYGRQPSSTEIFIVGEAIAQAQDIANSLASTARIACCHGAYPRQKATSGTFAMGIGGKFELETRECAEFCIYHLMSLVEGEEGAVDDDVIEGGKPRLFHFKSIIIGNGDGKFRDEEYAEPTISTATVKAVIPTTEPAAVSASIKTSPRTLIDIAKIIRSKNAGPYELTMDVMFDSLSVYELVKGSSLLTPGLIASLYNIPESEVIYCDFFDVALAFKATIPRKRNGKGVASGGYMENDVHGSQQYVKLMHLPLGEELIKKLEALEM